MKKNVLVLSFRLAFLILLVVNIASCNKVGEGILVKEIPLSELTTKERQAVPFLFGKDKYWKVAMSNGDTVNAVLPDYIPKKVGDSVSVQAEGWNYDFITCR